MIEEIGDELLPIVDFKQKHKKSTPEYFGIETPDFWLLVSPCACLVIDSHKIYFRRKSAGDFSTYFDFMNFDIS